MGLVAMYGMQFSNMKTYQFVTSMVINFFYTIIIEEPMKASRDTSRVSLYICRFRCSCLPSLLPTSANQTGIKIMWI